MDIRCPVCAEPWDMDELHNVPGMSFHQAWRDFVIRGCVTLGSSHDDYQASPLIADILWLLGDDVDGAASELDMLDYFGED